MGDTKISALTALTAVATDDALPVVDTDASTTKKITVANLFRGVTPQYQTTGFTVAGGTTSKTLTVSGDATVDQSVAVASSPTFVTAKLSGLTDGFVPYHSSDAVGLTNSILYTGETSVQSRGIFQHYSDIQILNKANDAWVNFAVRDTSGSEAVYNLYNTGSISLRSEVAGGTDGIYQGSETLIRAFRHAASGGLRAILIGKAGNSTMTGAADEACKIAAIGDGAAVAVTSGNAIVAIGQDACHQATSGNHLVGVGDYSLYGITTEANCTAVGTNALRWGGGGSSNTAVGTHAGGYVGGSGNVLAGVLAGTGPVNTVTNFVTNGSFASDTSGWTASNSTIAAVDGGQSGKCLEITQTVASPPTAYQDITIIVGKTYRLSFCVKSGSSGDEVFSVFTGDGAVIINGTSSSSWVSYSSTFVATGATPSLLVRKVPATAGTMLFDEITVFEVGTSTSYSVGVGYGALTNALSCSGVVAIGNYAFHSQETGNNSVALGPNAGYYETASDKLFIDNATRASESDGRVKALVYGVFNSATASQYLTVNGNLRGLESVSNSAADITVGSGTGLTVNQTGTIGQQVYRVTVDYTGFQSASSLTADHTIATLPAKTRLIAVYADVATLFSGGTVSAATLTLGKSAGGAEYLASHDVFTGATGAAPIGLIDADMGTEMTRAALIQGSAIVNWSGTTAVSARITTVTDTTDHLAAGSVTFYLITERL